MYKPQKTEGKDHYDRKTDGEFDTTSAPRNPLQVGHPATNDDPRLLVIKNDGEWGN